VTAPASAAAPGGVDVATIERELRELWEGMAVAKEGAPGSDRPVLRACVQNLVVYAPGENAREEVLEVLAEVSERHPSRMLVLLPRPDRPELHTSAYVTALCHLAGKSKQVCCEQIVIEAGPEGLRHLRSIVQPLLVPDLPVVLWWREEPPADGERLFEELRDGANRVIFDSSTLGDPASELARLVARLGDSRWTGYSDLAWAALTPWRSLLAGLFDVPSNRPQLGLLDRVEIDAVAPSGSTLPVHPLLLAGWLATRLGWRRSGPAVRTEAGTWEARLEAAGRRIDLVIRVQTSASPPRDRLHAVRLAASEAQARFEVRRSPDRGHLQTGAEMAGIRHCGTVTRVEDLDAAALIGQEIELLHHDRIYEAALRFWAEG
jgi:glucose-6-phosphate dehydrogenase assembly protein OpcA